MLDPSFSDWSAMLPVQGLALEAIMERGARFTTSAGPLSIEAYAPGVLRLRLGETTSPDYDIVVARPVPRAGCLEEIAGGWRLCAGDATLVLMGDPVQFDQAGVEVPGDGATWDQWTEGARKVAEATQTPFPMALDRSGHRLAGPAISMGAKYFDANGELQVVDEGFSQAVTHAGWP